MTLKECFTTQPVNAVYLKSTSPNLIKYPYYGGTRTYSGVTFSMNTDGSIDIKGTPTDGTSYTIAQWFSLTGGKQYTLSGYTKSSSSNNFEISVIDITNGNTVVAISKQYQTATFTATANIYYGILIGVYDASSNALDETIYPQLEEGIVATSYSLNKGDTSLEKVVYTGKNLFKPSLKSDSTITGITFTPNSDGTITVNGTATANATCLIGTLYATNKNCVLNGCPSGGGTSTYTLYAYDPTGNKTYYDYGNTSGVSFTGTNPVNLYIRVFSGATVSGLIFKPQVELGDVATSFEAYTEDVLWEVL